MGARKRQILSGLKRSVLPRLFTSWLDPNCISAVSCRPAGFGVFLFCVSAVCLVTHEVRGVVWGSLSTTTTVLFFFPPSYFPAESLIWMSIWVHLCDVYIYIYISCRLLLVRSISKGGAGHAATSQVAASQPNICRVSNLFSCSFLRSVTRTRSTAVWCSPAANTVLSLSGLH